MALRYNSLNVENELAQFQIENPNVTQDVILNKKKELIIREAVYLIAEDFYTRFDERPDTDMLIGDWVRSGKDYIEMRVRGYLERLPEEKRENFLEYIQEKALNADSKDWLKEFCITGSVDLSRQYLGNMQTCTVTGDDYVKGLFAPVTDPSGMLFEGLSENSLIKLQLLRDKQAEADEIKIDVPEGKTSDLVSFVVMGELFKEKHLNKTTDYLYSIGSTLPKNFSPADNAITSFFENTIVSESRANMHAIRLVVPDVRRDAKQIIDSGNEDAIKENLKNAFNVLYEKAVSPTSVSKTFFFFSVRQAGKLMETATANGISLEDIGITEDKIRRFNLLDKVAKFQIETERLTQSLQSKVENFHYSGFSAEYDMTDDDKKTLTEIIARDDIIKRISSELVGVHQMYELISLEDADIMMKDRKITLTEQRLLDDEQALIAESVEYVKSGKTKREIDSKMATPEGRRFLMSGGYDIDDRWENLIPVADYLNDIQDDFLANTKNYVDGKTGNEEILKAISSIKQKSEGLTAESPWEKFYELVEPYKALEKATDDFKRKIPSAELQPNSDAMKFFGTTEGLRSLIRSIDREPRRVAAQNAHDKYRAELRESVKDDTLKYDHVKFNERLEAYKLANPEATPEQLKSAEIDIKCDEALIYAQLDAYERCIENGRDIYNFAKYEKDARNYNSAYSVLALNRKLISKYQGDDKIRFMETYQKNLLTITTEKGFDSFRSIMTSLAGNEPEKIYRTVEDYGENVFRALFAAKTDNSGIRMDKLNENMGTVKNEDIQRWQKEADAIEIPKPQNMHGSIIPFLVMGRTTQQDLLLKASPYNLTVGSTLPSDCRKEANVLVSFWDNLMKNDERGNMHCIRAVVPEARADVKKAVEQNNTQKLNECLKNAFDVMYNQIISLPDHSQWTWTIPVKKYGEFMDAIQKSGINPTEIGIDNKKLEQLNTVTASLGLIKRMYHIRGELQKNALQYFESGFDNKYNPNQDTHAKDLVEELAVLHHSERNFYAEINTIRDEFKWAPINTVDDQLIVRDVDNEEKMYVKDPEAYTELMRRQVHFEVENKLDSEPDSFYRAVDLCNNTISVQSKIAMDTQHCEKYAVPMQLVKVKEALAKKDFDGVNGIDIVRNQLDRFIEQRNSFGDDFSYENMKKLVEPYKQLENNLIFVLNNSGELEDTPDYNTISDFTLEIKFYVKHINEEPERLAAKEQVAKEFEEIRRGMRPQFTERFETYKNALAELGAGSKQSLDFDYMMLSMDKFNKKVLEMYGEDGNDRNTILSRNDANQLKELFERALKGCSNYIERSGKNALTDDKVFLATECQNLLAKDLKFFNDLPNCKEITLSSALIARYGEPLNVSDMKDGFANLADKLAEVGSRFGGNSEEFDKMVEALNTVKNSPDKKKDFLDLTEKLAKAAQKYIDEKKTVPATEKGKQRLMIAREIRELCTATRNTANWEYFGDRQKDDRTYSERLMDYVDKKEKTVVSEMKKCINAQNKSKCIKPFTELIYLKSTKQSLESEGEAAAEYLQPAKKQAYMAKLEEMTDRMLKNTSIKKISETLMSDDAPEKLNKLFLDYVKDSPKPAHPEYVVGNARPDFENPVKPPVNPQVNP